MSKIFTTPPVLNNGVYLNSVEYNSESHLDSAHVTNLNQGKENITDLGIVQPFVSSGYLVKPYLYSFSNMGKNRIYLDGHMWTWKQPLHDEPCYIVADMSRSEKPGAMGSKFKIKVNKRKYDNGFVIAMDQHSPDHLHITEDEIIEDGDGVILTVRYKSVNAANQWFPKELLRPGTKLFAISTYETEFSQTYSSIPNISGGMRTYMQTISDSYAQLHYSVTRNAAFKQVNSNVTASIKDYQKVIEMYTFGKGTLGYDLSMQGQIPNTQKAGILSSAYSKKYGKGGMKQMKKDLVVSSWVPAIEAMGISYLEKMVEQDAIWGSGGTITYDGKGTVQTSLGLFHQLNMGNVHTYDLFNWSLQKFEAVLASRLKDRIEPFKSNEITIRTGQGGFAMVRNWLRHLPSQAGMVQQANDFIKGIGKDNQKLHWTNPNITSYEMTSGYGTIRFELAPGLDPIDSNEYINPMVPVSDTFGGHRLSSYIFIIDDITNSNEGNIVELMYGPDWDLRKSWQSGKLDYMGKSTYQRSSHHPGFEVYLEKHHKAYWVKDVTKSLLIKPINPFTGRPVFDSFFGGRG